MKAFLAFLAEIFTDAKKRPEIKMILGVPAVFIGLVVGVLMLIGKVSKDWTGWGAFMGVAVGLIITNAVTDAAIDKGGGQ